jgi:hypothetical protein
VEIKLIDHVGETQSGVFVDHQQWIVFAEGVQIGYLPKSPGAWLQCIVSMSEETKSELVESLQRKIANEVGGVVMPVDPDLEPQEEDE